MKRSEINKVIQQAEEDYGRAGISLPNFATWSPFDWAAKPAASIASMIKTGLGWDVTDFAGGRFLEKGLLLFTVRNGTPEGGPGIRPYAEKIMISRHDQLTPMHRHAAKVEDIINRSSLTPGARLAIQLFGMDERGGLARSSPVIAHLDGRTRDLDAGSIIELRPGESVSLFPGTFHAFWGEGGDVVVGEISSVNDDIVDNIFVESLNRFSEIEEDTPPDRLLVTDYRSIKHVI